MPRLSPFPDPSPASAASSAAEWAVGLVPPKLSGNANVGVAESAQHWLAAAVLVLVVVASYRMSDTPVTVTVDGRTTRLTTHAATVADLLVDQGILVAPADQVLPPPATRLHEGMRVAIVRARGVDIHVDGRKLSTQTHARTLAAILFDAGVKLAAKDVVALNGQLWPLDRPVDQLPGGLPDRPRDQVPDQPLDPVPSVALADTNRTVGRLPISYRTVGQLAGAPARPSATDVSGNPVRSAEVWSIAVYRAVPVTVVDEGIPFVTELAGPTIGEALRAAGVPLDPQDEVAPAPELTLKAAAQVVIRRAVPFVLEADGARQEVRALAPTIGLALERLGVSLAGRDYTLPPAQSPLARNMPVRVVRVKEDVLVREVDIPYRTTAQPDPSMDLDVTRVLSPGQVGLKRQSIRITYENGRESGRHLEKQEVVRDPVTEEVAYGTRVTWGTVDTPEGPKRYWRHLRVYATSYSKSRAGVSPLKSYFGHTRSGLPMSRGIVAIDTKVIPMRSNLFIPGFGIGVAGDTGGGIKRYHIDLGFDDENYESWHRLVDVYLLEPFPHESQMTWVLPPMQAGRGPVGGN